jgi:3-oxoacyl-[acyl-carrier protein] reductase
MSLDNHFPPAPIPEAPEGHGLLSDKIVLITAAAGTGIGMATAQRCLEEGAHVVISDAHERRLGETQETLSALGLGEVLGVPCDVTNEDAVQHLYSETLTHFGRLDVAVHNAGLGGTALLTEMKDEEWHKVIDVTLTGSFRCTRAALKLMQAQGSGVIVNNSSVLGWRAQPGQAHYAAAKAGVMALTRSAAAEGAPFGIRVNAIAPSLAEHPFLNKAISDDDIAILRNRELFHRGAEVWEVANVVIFLASGYSSYLSGEIISVSSQHP